SQELVSGIASAGSIPALRQRYRGNYRSDFRGALVLADCRCKRRILALLTRIFTPFDGGHVALKNNLPMPLAFRRNTVRSWEQRRKKPSGAARALLRLIEQKPELLEALQTAAT